MSDEHNDTIPPGRHKIVRPDSLPCVACRFAVWDRNEVKSCGRFSHLHISSPRHEVEQPALAEVISIFGAMMFRDAHFPDLGLCVGYEPGYVGPDAYLSKDLP